MARARTKRDEKVKKLLRKYQPVFKWAKEEKIVSLDNRYPECFKIDVCEVVADHLREMLEEAIDKFPYEISKSIITVLDEKINDLEDIGDYLSDKL